MTLSYFSLKKRAFQILDSVYDLNVVALIVRFAMAYFEITDYF